jgi:hypothetical protein
MTEPTIQEVMSAVALAMRLAKERYRDSWSEVATTVSEMSKAYAQHQETEESRGACDS